MRGKSYHLTALLGVSLALPCLSTGRPARAASKQSGVFYPSTLVANARRNAQQDPWAADVQKRIVKAAEPWMKLSDDQLWSLMFGNTIKRSWMVWSNGHCPACSESVPMYNWEMAALDRPWKTRCPHCKELFPKNDFHAFHRSGLDEHGVFDPERADRSLLVNVEHPDPADPLHKFGVDDGTGYVDGKKRWRFIGAYLIYGQWKQGIVGGIRNLAAAYVVTGDAAYAHKAALLLDRVADLYPTFDFGKEGVMYEGPPHRGYVSTWHDACREVRDLALAYDQVFEAMDGDEALVTFLAEKARRFKLDNPKTSLADVRRNVEQRILQDTLDHRAKIQSNYPQTDMAFAIIKAVLAWPANREEVTAMIDQMLKTATAVDGLSGEKGLAGYSTIAPRTMAELLGRHARVDPEFLAAVIKRHPRLRDMYRFHIDTWCLGAYYPLSGDTGAFARKYENYAGAPFSGNPGIEPSTYRFFWSLYQATGDKDFVRVMYRANGQSVKSMPYDLFADDPPAFRDAVRDVIADARAELEPVSVNKRQWHLALLRSGRDDKRRVAWLDYDAGGGHGHADGMHLGLFAKGLDLMPDFGYPPVQFGGWGSPRSRWYSMTAAHNTVVVDGKNQKGAAGQTTLWADGECFQAIRASAPKMIGGAQYERTVAKVDISDRDFYLLDVFRVVGGTDHAKFTSSHFGRVTPSGLTLEADKDFGHATQMRNFKTDADPHPGWSVDWAIEDRYGYRPPDSDLHLRYTDLTTGARASIAEAWVVVGLYDSSHEAWIPRVMVRRQAGANDAPLASTFISVIEPYEARSNIEEIRRVALETSTGKPYPEPNVAVEIRLADGRRDLLIAADVENPRELVPGARGEAVVIRTDPPLRFEGDAGFARLASDGNVARIALASGRFIAVGNVAVTLDKPTDLVEITFDGPKPTVVSGDPADVQEILVDGKPMSPSPR